MNVTATVRIVITPSQWQTMIGFYGRIPSESEIYEWVQVGFDQRVQRIAQSQTQAD